MVVELGLLQWRVCKVGIKTKNSTLNRMSLVMSLDVEGFSELVEGGIVSIRGAVKIRVQMGHFPFKTGLQPLLHKGCSVFS